MPAFIRQLTGAAAGVALMTGALVPAPALARDRSDKIDIEEIIIGAAVLAGVVAVASEIFKDHGRDWGYGRTSGQSVAVDECTRTAEREAERYGRYARVRDIKDVDRDGQEYRVKGEVEVERDGGWNRDSRDYQRVRFTCTARDGRVIAFQFNDNFDYAYRY
jgi:hypothetical protein